MKVVTFGELMLRLKPEGFLRFSQADSFEATFGGAEANVAVNLRQLGWDSSFVTRLPSHAIGEMALSNLRRYGVDVTKILRGGDRVGIYYLEKGADARASLCVYDRANSAIAAADPSEFNWEEILEGADVFFFTGITPALGQNMVKACQDACETARKMGVLVCCDTNFRAALWSLEQASGTMRTLMPFVDVIIGNGGLINDMFSLSVEKGENGLFDGEKLHLIGDKLRARFGCRFAALTQRETLSSDCHRFYGGILGETFGMSRIHTIRVVDRVGGGDAFAAGAILAIAEGMDAQSAAEFAAASGVLAHSVEGDFNLCSRQEVEKLAAGGDSQIVR